MQGRRTAAIIESAKILRIQQFKQKQVEAIESFLGGKDTLKVKCGTSGLELSLMTVFNSSDSTDNSQTLSLLRR